MTRKSVELTFALFEGKEITLMFFSNKLFLRVVQLSTVKTIFLFNSKSHRVSLNQ